MGGGFYNSNARLQRAVTAGYDTKPIHEVFKQKEVSHGMKTAGISVRESRDSIEHPESMSIILALDVTGSMGMVPHHLVKDGLPTIMGNIIQHGTKHPQLCFLAIGDHECDRSPLQAGQFESSDELLDKWLTETYLEGGGGGNAGESYLLAWYFAAAHTAIDCWEKRQQKGFLFTIGDEPTLKEVPGKTLTKIMGGGQHQDLTADELLERARAKYHVYHIHTKETWAGSKQNTIDGWKQLMGDNCIVVDNHKDIPSTIARVVKENTCVTQDDNTCIAPENQIHGDVTPSNSNEDEQILM